MPTINLGKPKHRDRTINKVKYQNVYQSKAWRNLRALKFANNPLCELCLLKGKVTQTEEVHHIIPFDVNPDLAYDYDNLMSLCSECHSKIHKTLIHDRK